jgi:hypothetical protein
MELGCGRSISFNHHFIGRDALLAAKETAPYDAYAATEYRRH